MGKYSIKELEQLSGIKAHTIRVWEKRHRIIKPQRTHTNIRFYSDDDLKKIINVSMLKNHGVKISKIIKLSPMEINQQITEFSESKNKITTYLDQLIVAMIDMEEERFEKLLGSLALKFGFERTMLEVVYPFLEKIGVLWLTDNITPAQEHFVSHLIRQKIIVAIDALPLAPKTEKKAVLFLPENELHELGLLFYHYIVKKSGIRTYYLGQTVPHRSLQSTCKEHKPDLLITSLTTEQNLAELQKYLRLLSSDFPAARVLVSGHAIKKSTQKPPKNITFFANVLMLKEILLKHTVKK
jgi:MerR family transcriptional regulator, light-induced transcriptional regulator